MTIFAQLKAIMMRKILSIIGMLLMGCLLMQAQEQSEIPEPDSGPEEPSQQEEEPVAATVLDNGIDDEQDAKEKEDPIPDEPDTPF